MFSTSSNDLRSNPEQSVDTSQHPIQPQNLYERFKGIAPQMLGADTTTLGVRRAVPDGHEQHSYLDITNDTPRTPDHDSLNPPSVQAEGRNLPSISEPATIPVATHLQGAQNFTNIGINMGPGNLINVTNYGGTHGLENLKDLVSFAAFHDSAEQDPSRRCHPGTRETVLRQLRDWVNNPNVTEPIFWLHGPAGAGKSAIAQTIAHEYKQGEVAATFFFYRSDAERNNGNRLFPTLAWQLAFSIPTVKNFIVHALDKTPPFPRKDIETQFEQLVAYPFESSNNITSQLSQPAPVVVIDGLDECSDEELQRRILAIIGNAVKDRRVPLRFLISSRSEALIEDTLYQFKDSTLQIDLATLDDSHRDIEKYLVGRFSVIASMRDLAPAWLGQEIIKELVFQSSGNFIFTATVMRLLSDEDYDPEEQLDIVRNLKPQGMMSPFALLDELYLEILKRQRDQDFLKTFLALCICRSSINEGNLHEDDAMLMNISEKELVTRLLTMRSLLKLEPFIDVYHKSFLDFLQDPSRSGQYHVTKQGATRLYVELVVNSIVQNVTRVIKDPDYHRIGHFAPEFVRLFKPSSIAIQLSAQDWEEILHPIERAHYDLHRKLQRGYCDQCRLFQVTDNLLSHLNSLRESGSGQRDFNMNFGRLSFGLTAVVGLLLALA